MLHKPTKHDQTGTYPAVRAANAEPSGPGMIKCRRPGAQNSSPEEFDADLFAAQCFDEFCRNIGLTNTEIADRWGVSESIVRDVRTRHKPLTASKIARLPPHERDAFVAVLFLRFDERTKAA